MRIIARFPDERQVSSFVDSSRHMRLDRKDMIISNLANDKSWHSLDEAAENSILIKSETDDIGQAKSFSSDIKGFKEHTGIIVAVKVPKHTGERVRLIMEQNGALEIVED